VRLTERRRQDPALALAILVVRILGVITITILASASWLSYLDKPVPDWFNTVMGMALGSLGTILMTPNTHQQRAPGQVNVEEARTVVAQGQESERRAG
jgi:hypothetical protein